MSYSKSIDEIIKLRESWRTYINKDVDEEELKELTSFIENLKESPFGEAKTRFKIVSLKDSSKINQFATYGMVKNAPYYILGAVEKFSRTYEHYGYIFEKIILKATEINLGTCWLGGTVDRKKVSEIIKLEDNEIIPAVTPIGYVEERRFMGKAVRWLIRAKKRKEWENLFYRIEGESLASIKKGQEKKYSNPLEMVRLGPSAKNRQPWRIIKEDEKNIHFYRADSATYARLDIAIAVCHFDLTCKEEGINGRWDVQEPSNLDHLIPEGWKYSISWQEV
ncbi:MAG: nitroreductase family protein [Promethearchaeia archaeon]